MSKLTDDVVIVTGESGEKYKFNIFSINTEFIDVGGIYIFTKRSKDINGKYDHDLIYCGETGDVSVRFDNHHKKDCIEKEGANCICFMSVNIEKERLAIEKIFY